MTAVMDAETVTLKVSARAAATAWLNAFLATGDDDDRPLLYRTLSLEIFQRGIHIIGCNGVALFRTWVPMDPSFASAWPNLDERRRTSVIVMDPDGFGSGFMKTLLTATNDEAHQQEVLSITVAEADEEAGAPALGKAFHHQRLILRALGQRIDLRILEDKYPNWRALELGVTAGERVKGMTFGPRILALLGKMKEVGAVDLDFRARDKKVDFVGRNGDDVAVRGMVMPMIRPSEKVEKASPDQTEL